MNYKKKFIIILIDITRVAATFFDSLRITEIFII